MTEPRRNGAALRTKFGEGGVQRGDLSCWDGAAEAEASEGRFLTTELRACRWGRCDIPEYTEKMAENAYFCMFLANHTTRIM